MRIKRLILLLFIFQHFAALTNAQSFEYAIKASFIEKFARLTEWQTNLPDNFFVIGLIGKSPFNGELEKLAQKLTIKNKPVKIIYYKNSSEIDNCQILFVCTSEKNNLPAIFDICNSKNILTISDTPGFCKKGTHINLYIDELKTVKYEVNPDKLKSAHLIVDMQVLKFGKLIR